MPSCVYIPVCTVYTPIGAVLLQYMPVYACNRTILALYWAYMTLFRLYSLIVLPIRLIVLPQA